MAVCMAVLFTHNHCAWKCPCLPCHTEWKADSRFLLYGFESLMALFLYLFLSLPLLFYSCSLFIFASCSHSPYLLISLLTVSLSLLPPSSTLPFLYTLIFLLFLFPPSSFFCSSCLCYLTPSLFFVYVSWWIPFSFPPSKLFFFKKFPLLFLLFSPFSA